MCGIGILQKKEVTSLSLEFIDCNCSIGMRNILVRGSFYKTNKLIEKMEVCGISKAMVYHNMAEEYHPMLGNKVLMDEIKDFKNLFPVWVVMPNHTKEFLSPRDLIKTMKQNNVKLVRMFPGETAHNYGFLDLYCGELFRVLNEYKIPLMIGMDKCEYEEVFAVAKEYRELPMILTEVGYRGDRYLYPLLEKLPNIYIESSSYKVVYGIEAICENFGSERLIFGTSMPLSSPGSAVTMITHADISSKDKKNIARENLISLLGAIEND